MSTLRQAAQSVIKQWDGPDWEVNDIAQIDAVYSALRTALAAPEQEPHGWMIDGVQEAMSHRLAQATQSQHHAMGGTALAYPVYREPVVTEQEPVAPPLLPESEIVDLLGNCSNGGWFKYHAFARSIESAVRKQAGWSE